LAAEGIFRDTWGDKVLGVANLDKLHPFPRATGYLDPIPPRLSNFENPGAGDKKMRKGCVSIATNGLSETDTKEFRPFALRIFP